MFRHQKTELYWFKLARTGVNNFVYNTDFRLEGHNMNVLFDATGKAVHGAYDFDLSSIVTGVNFNNMADYSNQVSTMIFQLEASPRDSVVPIVKRVVEQEAAMRVVIEKSEISSEMKNRFSLWFDQSFPALQSFLHTP